MRLHSLCGGWLANANAHELFHLVNKALPCPGADVIVRKVRQFIAYHRPGECVTFGKPARHEWLGLAHDHIGAWEVIPFLRLPDRKINEHQLAQLNRRGCIRNSSQIKQKSRMKKMERRTIYIGGMEIRKIYLIGGIVALVLIVLGVGAFVFLPHITQASTQSVTPTPTARKAGPGVYVRQYSSTIRTQIAQGLHLTTDQLTAQLQSGKTLPQIATAQNVSTDQLNTLISTSVTSALQPVVSSGKITQQQVNRLVQSYQKNPQPLDRILGEQGQHKGNTQATPTATATSGTPTPTSSTPTATNQ
jgi:hypothetical protein